MAIVKKGSDAADRQPPRGKDMPPPPPDGPEGNPPGINWGKLLLTSITGLGVLIYAIGYCCHAGHHKMLGVCYIECPHETVVHDGALFFVLALLSVLAALCTLRLAWIVLLVSGTAFVLHRCVRYPSEGRFCEKATAVILSKVAPAIIMASLHVLFFFLAAVIASQMDLLLAGTSPVAESQTVACVFTALTSHSPQLPELLADIRCARSVYGLIFLTAAMICLWWVGWLFRSGRRSAMRKEEGKWLRLRRTAGRVVSVLVLYLLLLSVVLVFYLYGFLVKSNRYPVIKAEGTAARLLASETLFVLGDSGSRAVLYSVDRGEGKVWWVEKSAYLPASRSEPAKNLFECIDCNCACHETQRTSR